MDEMRLDLKDVLGALGTFSSWLGETERGLDRVSKAASEERSSKMESAPGERSATEEAASKGDAGEENPSAFGKLVHARKVSEGVMEGLRGRPTPDDSTLSPTRRLEKAMKGLAEEEEVLVQRPPQQVRRRAAEKRRSLVRWRKSRGVFRRRSQIVGAFLSTGMATRARRLASLRCLTWSLPRRSCGRSRWLFRGLERPLRGQLTTRARKMRRPRMRVLAVGTRREGCHRPCA